MKINISTLEEGSKTYNFQFNGKEILQETEDFEITGPVVIQAEVFRNGYNITIKGNFSTEVQLSCSRCLEPVRTEVNGDYICDFRPEITGKALEFKEELSPEELDIVWYSGNELDLAEQIRQALIIHLPMQPLCRESCKGLCPQCGTNLNKSSCHCHDEDETNPFRLLRGLKLD